MKRLLLIIGALLVVIVVVVVRALPGTTEPLGLTASAGPAAGASTVDLGNGWFADLLGVGENSCVSVRNDAAQSPCVGSTMVVSGSQVWTFHGQGLRVTMALVGNGAELTAQWSSRDQSGGPCCRSAEPMTELQPDVWLSIFATPDDDEHWGLQLRHLDGGLHEEHSLVG